MMNKKEYESIPASAFEFVPLEGRMHDKKLESKPVGYFRDAFNRFCRNKSSVVAAFIILALFLYAVFVPIFCENKYTLSLTDPDYTYFSKLPPKSSALAWLGIDGTRVEKNVNEINYNKYKAFHQETGLNPVLEQIGDPKVDATQQAAYDREVQKLQEQVDNAKNPALKKQAQKKLDKKLAESVPRQFDLRLNPYYLMGDTNGMHYLDLTLTEFQKIQAWQNANPGKQVIFPAVSEKLEDASIWYARESNGNPVMDENGVVQHIYVTGAANDPVYQSTRIPGDDGTFKYYKVGGSETSTSYRVRVCLYNYFEYKYGFEPEFLFGTNTKGQDIFTRLASGARFSFILAIGISAINLCIGAIYGAIQGYYGGTVDLVLDRISDVLNNVPFMVVTTLFQLHLANKVGPVVALIFAFVLTGWIGMAARVRMQFYRFKGQEYILAARTLGARDSRLMFKHIFPNSLGTIITGSVLVIPGMIFSESSMTYLGIVNLESSTMTSVGTMLANGKDQLQYNPYIILFPAVFVSLLMISFNLFGNGLRDAFNPSLRGAE